MKHKLVRRVIASVMTALLVVGLIPMTFTGGGVKVSAADGKYVFDATTLTAAADKEEIGEIAFVSELRKRDQKIDEINEALLRFF